MTRPTTHPRTGGYLVRIAIPADLRETAMRLYGVGREFRENLRTKDAAQAKRLAPDAIARLADKIARTRSAVAGELPTPSSREIAALAGEWYRRKVGAQHAGDPDLQDLHMDIAGPLLVAEGPPTADQLGATAWSADLLEKNGFATDPETIAHLALALVRAGQDWHALAVRRADGDWSSDPALAKIPALPSRAAKPQVSAPGCTFDAVLAGWAADRGLKVDARPIPRALYDRQRTLARLAIFLGHSDAAAVTQADAVRWKEDMQRRELHASTVRNDLSEMSAIWTWGLKNGKLSPAPNPFAGISPPKAKKKGREPRAFSDEEAALVLRAARNETGALRWLPWLACLTGTRINEICQADKADVLTVDGIPVIRIHDEGDDRNLKNEDSRRTIPIHPALIQEGFLRYVAGLPKGPLFPDVPPDATFGLRGVTGSKRVGRWVRSLGIDDIRISPSHSWRHWFIGACRRVSMHVEVRSALTGHSAKLDESAGYGDGMKTFLHVLSEAISKVSCPVIGPPASMPP